MPRKKNNYRLWAFTPHLRGRLISLLLAVFLYFLETAEVLAWCLRCFIAGFLFTVWAYLVCVLFADTSVHANGLPQNHLDIANVWLWQPYIQSCNSIMQVIRHTMILKKILTLIFILCLLFLVVCSLVWLNVCVVIGNFFRMVYYKASRQYTASSYICSLAFAHWGVLYIWAWLCGCWTTSARDSFKRSKPSDWFYNSTASVDNYLLGVGKLFQGKIPPQFAESCGGISAYSCVWDARWALTHFYTSLREGSKLFISYWVHICLSFFL